MTLAADNPDRWAPRRWWIVTGGVLLMHVAGAMILSQQRLAPPRVHREELTLQFVNGLAAESGVLGTDPTLFALLNAQAFSGRAWFDYRLFQHSLDDWQEPPRWLGPEGIRFGVAFQRLAASNTAGLTPPDDKPAPRVSAPAVGGVATPTRSMLSLSRGLAGRPLQSTPDLPAWPHSDVLADTLVQVSVNAAGDVLTARLLAGCGLKAADDGALAVARGLRFAPLPPERREPGNPWASLVTGTVTFHWVTREPAAGGAPP